MKLPLVKTFPVKRLLQLQLNQELRTRKNIRKGTVCIPKISLQIEAKTEEVSKEVNEERVATTTKEKHFDYNLMKVLLIEGSGGDISPYSDVLKRVGITEGYEVELLKF